jgi:hypothetical protein
MQRIRESGQVAAANCLPRLGELLERLVRAVA